MAWTSHNSSATLPHGLSKGCLQNPFCNMGLPVSYHWGFLAKGEMFADQQKGFRAVRRPPTQMAQNGSDVRTCPIKKLRCRVHVQFKGLNGALPRQTFRGQPTKEPVDINNVLFARL